MPLLLNTLFLGLFECSKRSRRWRLQVSFMFSSVTPLAAPPVPAEDCTVSFAGLQLQETRKECS